VQRSAAAALSRRRKRSPRHGLPGGGDDAGVDLDVLVAADGAGDHVAVWRPGAAKRASLLGDHPLADLRGDEGVVVGDLGDLVVAGEVDAAVAHLAR
jgi:hypothetical protein